MSRAKTRPRVGSSRTHERIGQAAIRLYREIGYRKTTVADIARGASMSPANLYRFYPSRRALDEAVVAELLEGVSAVAANAARRGGSGPERLGATLGRSPGCMRIGWQMMSGCTNWWLRHYRRIGRLPCLMPTGSAVSYGRSLRADRPVANFGQGVRWRWPAACLKRWMRISIHRGSRQRLCGRPSTR